MKSTMKNIIARLTGRLVALSSDKRAATAIEYGLIAAGIAVVVIVAVKSTGNSLNGVFTNISTAI